MNCGVIKNYIISFTQVLNNLVTFSTEMLSATLLSDHQNCITLKKNDEPFKLIKTFSKSLPFLPFLWKYFLYD